MIFRIVVIDKILDSKRMILMGVTKKSKPKIPSKAAEAELLWFLLEILASTNNPHFIQCNKSRF